MARAARARELDRVVVATTSRPVDDAIAEHARRQGWSVYRGDPDDVAGRLVAAAEREGAGAFARLNGDSPFLDPDLLDEGVRRWRRGDVDFVTNIMGRTYPYGISVEVIRLTSLRNALGTHASAEDREHVTAFWYRHPEKVRHACLQSSHPQLSAARLVVDTPEDARRMEALIRRLGDHAERAGFREVAEAYLDMVQSEGADRVAEGGGGSI